MSFGEYVTTGGFNQKTGKEDLFIKENYGIPSHKQLGKHLEDTRRQYTKAGPRGGPTYRPPGPLGPPIIFRRLVLLPTIYTVDFKAVLGRFIQR